MINIYDTKYKKQFIFKETYNSIIPLTIYQTWHTKLLPPKMFENILKLKQNHPRFKYYLYDDNDCREFIKNNFDTEILQAFDKLIPGAYKADLWRYCILYKNGGIYLDIKFKCMNNFRLIALTEEEQFVNDIGNVGIYNALIAVMPKNDILLKCINKIVENVKNNYYGEGCLYPTGPMLMKQFFDDSLRNNIKLNLETLKTSKDTYHSIIYNNIYVLINYYEYRDEQIKYQKKEHYGILWDARKIYN